MPPRLFALAFAAGLLTFPAETFAQSPPALPRDPMRIAILVDTGQHSNEPMPLIRRALGEFVKALPPEHELMLVSTGAQMNIRVQPTTDYFKIQEAAGELFVTRGGGNVLLGSMQEIYDRYFRTVERRWPVFVIVSTDGPDMSPTVNTRSMNQLLEGLSRKFVQVNAVLLTSTADSLVRSITLAMIEQTGGFYESATIATALPGRMKSLAAKIEKSYKSITIAK